jgi:thiol-disulfide isomerase/thioredoxin
MQAKLRRLAPAVLLLGAFFLIPLLARSLFPDRLPDAMPALHAQPLAVPAITMTDGAGGTVTLERFRGAFVLLNVWATWCVPCKQEMPSLNALAAHFPAKDLLIVPVSIDTSGAVRVRGYYKEFALDKLPVYLDPSSDAMHALGVIGVPTTLLIDREGREIARQVGPLQWDSQAVIDGMTKIIAR